MRLRAFVLERAKSALRQLVRASGWDVVKYPALDFAESDLRTWEFVRAFTITSAEAVSALCGTVRYIVRHRIPGAFVECGVWRGGSMMAVARTLLELGDTNSELYLFDTFRGMTRPTDKDLRYDGLRAAERQAGGYNLWRPPSLSEVRRNLRSVGYDPAKTYFIEGRVEDTIPARAPSTISLLRLDTDWYESTRHELVHLFPRLSEGGVIIIDDYGHWLGARRATDEFILEHDLQLLLHRIDYTCRIGVKR